MNSIRITPKPLGPGYRGRRARRQAFAHQQRMCRLLNRIYRASRSALDGQMQRAMEAWIATGTAFIDGAGNVLDARGVRL